MKRVIIVCVLLAFCTGVSVYTYCHVGDVNDRIMRGVNGALGAIAEADEENLRVYVDDLSAFWDEEEDRLIHLIRHSQIDDITKSIARLQALAAGEDYSELAAELMSIRWQMDHISRSERMIFPNLL